MVIVVVKKLIEGSGCKIPDVRICYRLASEQSIFSEHVEVLFDKKVADLFVRVDSDESRATVAINLITVVAVLETLE